MGTAFALNSLFREPVRFGYLNDLMGNTLRNGNANEQTMPRYDIEKHGDDAFSITLEVPGFEEQALDVNVEGNTLTVAGRVDDGDGNGETYVRRGIARRAFKRTFTLGDYVHVKSAELKYGLLRIRLERELPEEAKPRVIPITLQ